MTKYIDVKALDLEFLRENDKDPNWTPERVQALILRQPFVDAIPVTRCRDCHHCGLYSGKTWKFLVCEFFHRMTRAECYCSNAKKKEDAT